MQQGEAELAVVVTTGHNKMQWCCTVAFTTNRLDAELVHLRPEHLNSAFTRKYDELYQSKHWVVILDLYAKMYPAMDTVWGIDIR